MIKECKPISILVREINTQSTGSKEAIITFELQGKEYKAYSYPHNFVVNKFQDAVFDFIESDIDDDVFWDSNVDKVIKLEQDTINPLKYYCYGKIIDINPVMIDCGDLTFDYGDISNDSRIIGHYVYFVIDRLDVSKCL